MNNKKFGFTLAEVLITLAIIGVVAALTLPTLLANYQKKELATKLIKTHAELTQAFKMLMAEDSVSQLSTTKLWTTMPEEGCSTTAWRGTTFCENCREFLNKYIEILPGSTLVDYPDLKPTYNKAKRMNGEILYFAIDTGLNLKNGALITWNNYRKYPLKSEFEYDRQSGNLIDRIGYFDIDLNGQKGPNTYGYDIFSFYIGDDGTIYPRGGTGVSYFDCGDDSCTWKGNNERYNCNSSDENSMGWGCAARVLETGKMDY